MLKYKIPQIVTLTQNGDRGEGLYYMEKENYIK